MFSHVTLGTNDWERAKPFWAAIASALSLPLLFEHDSGIAYGLSWPKADLLLMLFMLQR